MGVFANLQSNKAIKKPTHMLNMYVLPFPVILKNSDYPANARAYGELWQSQWQVK